MDLGVSPCAGPPQLRTAAEVVLQVRMLLPGRAREQRPLGETARAVLRCRSALALGTAVALVVLWTAQPALGSAQQLAMFEDDSQLQANPEKTLDTFRTLGVGIVRVYVNWSAIAPRPGSRRRPAGFDGANPGAYPAAGWAIYDRIDRAATARGIAVDFTLSGDPPLWADGRGAPAGAVHPQWQPSASEYGRFVRAVATRYSGSYSPHGSAAPLPRVNFWAIWNEPNFGKDLAPQAINGSTILFSPIIYRSLLDQAWSALQATGHGRDTILIGSLAARGASAPPGPGAPEGFPGNFATTKPLQFIRALYCVDSQYRELRGPAAAARGCPTKTAASRRFRTAHPALFKASGFADHPYPLNLPPTKASSPDPDYTEFSELSRLGSVLDRVQRSYGSRTRLPIYVTEYGYITNPPNHSNHYVSPATAAYYMNWTEYLSWRNPRVATTMQYLLYDPNPSVGVPEFGGFASGLIPFRGPPKPGYHAYALPLYMPVSTTRHGHSLEVWGCVRPAFYASHDTHAPQTVQVQFQRGSVGPFATVRAVTITNRRGYFDVKLAFSSSGAVRLAWSHPPGTPAYSRVQRVTVS